MPPWTSFLLDFSGSRLGAEAPSVLRSKQTVKRGFESVGVNVRLHEDTLRLAETSSCPGPVPAAQAG